MILYEDNHLLIVNKRPGMLVQGDKTGDEVITDQFKKYLKEKYSKPGNVFLHPAHRLDRPTSGALILCRTSKSLTRMTKKFRDHSISKTYLTITTRQLPHKQGELNDLLLKDAKRNRTRVVDQMAKGVKPASLTYKYITEKDNLYLYRILPTTGRSHQIRVQLAHRQCPILGDVKYGGRTCDNDKLIYLHCYQLVFFHPTTREELVIQAQPTVGGYWEKFSSMI